MNESSAQLCTLAALRQRSRWLAAYARNEYSQTGEDGLLEQIFSIIGEGSLICVEVGAWNGLHGSNTRRLLLSGWHGLQIECDAERFRELAELYRDRPDIRCLQRRAWIEGPDSLDAILAEARLPIRFDLLSIDIDGNDYHLWAALSHHRPRVVVIEYNFSIPDEVTFFQPANLAVAQGCSLRALIDLGKEKGYELVFATGLNAIFVDHESFALFGIPDNSIEVMHVNRFDARTHLFFGYDGTVFVRGAARLPWHDLPIPEARFQLLPPMLRKHCGYSRWQQLCFLVWRAHLRGEMIRPSKWLTAIRLVFGGKRITNIPDA